MATAINEPGNDPLDLLFAVTVNEISSILTAQQCRNVSEPHLTDFTKKGFRQCLPGELTKTTVTQLKSQEYPA